MTKYQHAYYIEDNEVELFLFERFNQQFSVFDRLQLFKSPLKALEALQCETPDIILLDIDMPLMNGFDFLDELIVRGITIPVHLLSVSIQPKDIDKAREYPQIHAFHHKPVRQEVFARLQAY
jgi:CheY-like chemotaxis protein